MDEYNTCRFSIIVPVFNIEKYLPKCIDSILNQTFSDFELILVDDGSTDKSYSICDYYGEKDNRVRIVHKRNGGPVSARQAGLSKAGGEYIVCVDGDDWIDSNYLRLFDDQIQEYHPDMVCCGYSRSMIDSEKKMPMPNRKGFYSRKEIENEIFPNLIQSRQATYFRPSLWAKTIKREIFKQQQMVDCNVNVGEDGACVIPCVYHSNSLVVLNDCLYHYRVNESSITKNRKPFRWDGPQIIGEHIQSKIDLDKYDFKMQLDRKICHELFSVVISHCFQYKKKYKDIKFEVIKEINRPYYRKAINDASFSSIMARIMHCSLKYNIFAIMWVFARFKKF